MSAGAFVRSKYQASYDIGTQIHPIRVQPETISAVAAGDTNAPPDGSTNNPISAKISLGRRARGLSPRYITLQFPLTGQPTGYKAGGITRIPALTQGWYDGINAGDTVTYLGVACIVVSKTPENAD